MSRRSCRRALVCYFGKGPFGWVGTGRTNTGLALVGRNSRGTQALKQNIAELSLLSIKGIETARDRNLNLAYLPASPVVSEPLAEVEPGKTLRRKTLQDIGSSSLHLITPRTYRPLQWPC